MGPVRNAAPPGPARDEHSSPQAWVLFDVARRRCALPAKVVAHAVAAPPLVAVPFAGPLVAGAANVSGDVIAVIDAARWLGLSREAPAAALVVVQDATGLVGLLADRLRRVASLPRIDAAARPDGAAPGRRVVADDREGEIIVLIPSDLPAPDSLYDLPDATSRASLSGSIQPIRPPAVAGATDRRNLLTFTSAGQTRALPLGAVARIRDKRENAAGERPGDGHRAVSLASLLGMRPAPAEPFVIEVSSAGLSLALEVEAVVGLQREGGALSQAASAAFLQRLLGSR